MKKYKASEFSRNPKPVYQEAAKNGVIIQKCNTNGEVEEEFIVIKKCQSVACDLCQESESGYVDEFFGHIRVDADDFRDKAFERRMKKDAQDRI